MINPPDALGETMSDGALKRITLNKSPGRRGKKGKTSCSRGYVLLLPRTTPSLEQSPLAPPVPSALPLLLPAPCPRAQPFCGPQPFLPHICPSALAAPDSGLLTLLLPTLSCYCHKGCVGVMCYRLIVSPKSKF